MQITRIWAMPNKWTFTIKPIKALLNKYVIKNGHSIDPFAGQNSPANETNDLNPNNPAKFHLDALDFLSGFKEDNTFDTVFFDPPYSNSISWPKLLHQSIEVLLWLLCPLS
ncbi:hypothetical protein LCGC14_1379750 [marine sediment metagenome]|uniref:Uncharacterized protein n=1 Tax=marine sediment metagenome TaxID=412755 RepID=A0A0F9K3E2_9ZZZZ